MINSNWKATDSSIIWQHIEDSSWLIIKLVTNDFVIHHPTIPFPERILPTLFEAMSYGDRQRDAWENIKRTINA